MILFRKTSILIFLISIFDCNRNNIVRDSEKSFKHGAVFYVTSTDGLYLRSTADISATKISLIPFGQEIHIISTDTLRANVNGKSGNWVKVEWRKNSGYVFDYYLTDDLSQLLAHRRFDYGEGCTGLTYTEYSWRLVFLPNFQYRSEHISGYGTSCNLEHIVEGSYELISGKITLKAKKVSNKIVGGKICSKMVLRPEIIEIYSRYNDGSFVLTKCENKPAIAETYESQRMFILMSNRP